MKIVKALNLTESIVHDTESKMNDLKNQLPQEVEEYLEEEREEKMQSTDFGAFMRSINELEELLEEEEQEMSKERRFLEGRVHEIQTKLVKEMERSKQMMKLKNDYEQAIKELEEKLGKEQQARQELEKVLDEKIHQVEDLQYQISKREEEVQHALQSAEEESVSKASSMKQMREVQNQIKELQEDLEAERESRNTAEKQKRDISEVYIQAVSGKGHAVTEVMLWEGPVDGIATFNHYRESDWTQEFCSCCFITPIPENCTACNCTKYLSDKFGNDNVTAPPTMSTTTMVQTTTQPYEIVQTVKTNEKDIVYNITNPGNTTVTDQEPVDTSTSPAQPSCGIQVVADTSPYLVSWCRLYNDSLTPLYTDDDLDFDPSAGFHDYKMVVDYEKYDQIEKTWCLKVYVDRYMFSKIFGIPEFSSDTKLLLHVFNKNNYVPPITDLFDVFSTRASFRNVIMPPSSDAMCRYGGVIPIDRYEAGIGTDQLMTDVVSYQEVLDPCIPCYSPCAPYTCQTTCNPTEQKLLNFTLTDLSLPAKREENTTGQLVNTSISYFLTVKSVLSSGKSAEASSSVFYIDDTLPWFDLDQMTPMYIDIKQGELTPVSFQSSNSTIKAFWRCIDEESQIVENWWSIGTLVGGDDLQPWTSVGEDQIASNNSFGGILQNNKTYYVSVRCRNGAGLEATHTDKIGVRVLLEPPSANGVIVTIPDSSDFTGIDIYPNGSRTTTFDSSMGMTFTVGTDQSIYRYDWCLGSDELRDDIFPCTWIGHNASGTIKIQNGWLTINTADIRRLSEFNPAQDSSLSETERLSDDNNVFKMEPGRTIFMMLQVCNEAVLCTPLQIASVLVINDKSVVCPLMNGDHGIRLEMKPDTGTCQSYKRKRHASHPDEIDIVTSNSGILTGQSLLLQPMDNATLTANYLSSASDNFLPYIVNPYNTTDKLKRLLHGRWNKSEFTFCLASVGHVPYSGPITMTYDDTEDGKNSGMKLIITHWNPRNQQWEITSRSCLGVDGVTDLEVQDPTHSSTHTIKQKDDEINQLKKETTRLNKVRETIQRRLRQIEDLKAEVEQQKEILKSQNLALERDLDATIKKVDTGKKENQDVKKFETEKKLRELEAELEDERYQGANALNSRKKLENNIKDLRQQAELAVCVKEDAVKQLKRVQAQMNDNQTELDSLMMKCKPP